MGNVQNRNPVVGAGNETAVPGGAKDDSSIGKIGWFYVVMSAAGTFVGIAVVIEIRDLPQIFSVDTDFVDGGIAVGSSFEAEEDFRCVPRQRGIEVESFAEGFGRVCVDDGADTVFFRRIGRGFEDVDSAAGSPLIKRIVNVQSLIVESFGKEDRRREDIPLRRLEERCREQTQ